MDEVTVSFDEVIARPKKLTLKRISSILGYMLALAGLIWVLYDFRLDQFRAR